MTDEWCGQRLHQYAIFDRDDSMLDILQGPQIENINAPDRCKRTPVYTAVSNNSLKCLEILLQHGANTNLQADHRLNRMTPLHQALIDGKVDAIRLLLRYGADLNIPDDTGLSPLALARNIGVRDYIQMFEEEEKKREEDAANVVDELCLACQDNDVATVNSILRQPVAANLNVADMPGKIRGKTPLCCAAEMGYGEIFHKLIGTVRSLDARYSPIHPAVTSGNLQMVTDILEKIPESCSFEGTDNQMPLHIACDTGVLDIVKCLLEWPYPDSVSLQNLVDAKTKQKTPLYIACEKGHDKIVQYLLEFTINKNQTGTSDVESQTVSISGDNVSFKPVKVEHAGSGSLSCVYTAVQHGNHRIVDLLVKAGAQLDLTERQDGVEYSVLLMFCLKNRDLLMLDKLLQYNVEDVNNQALKEAIIRVPEFIPHILKYKASEDKNNAINKSLMKQEFGTFVNSEELESMSSLDPKYKQIFPTVPVYVRWKHLNILSCVEEAWLNCVSNIHNPAMTNVNTRIPSFAITRVDVSNSILTMLPTALLKLPSLCSLTAANNKITDFPKLESFNLQCQSLEELYIQNNLLETLPDYLFKIPNLRTLCASKNKLCELPACMWQMKTLKLMDLTDNQLDCLPQPDNRSFFTTSIHHRLSSGTDPADSLSADQSLASINDHVISSNVKHTRHWTTSLISDEDLKSTDTHLQGLKTLKLGKNRLAVFPDFLSCCVPQLETLELSRNRLVRMSVIGAYPRMLKVLDLSQNAITDMADWLLDGDSDVSYCSRKRNLSSPGVSPSLTTPLPCVHRRHWKLENLETLDLSANRLTSIVLLRDGQPQSTSAGPASFSKSLKEKEEAEQDLQGRLLFPSLNSLNLDMNLLTSLPPEIGQLRSLGSFFVKKNTQLKKLPPELGLLSHLRRMEVEMCPIEGPIQDMMKGQGNTASHVLGFLRSVLEESEEYNCMNLMVVGTFRIGKTSLLEQLARTGKAPKKTHYVEREEGQTKGRSKDGDFLSTVGIDISHLVLSGKPSVEFRTWDFAGQKEYYATHQYFLSPRSLYLVVWNITQGEPGVAEIRQWLVNIQAQAPGAPVLIVGTHMDVLKANKRNYPRTWVDEMTALIKQKYMITEPDKSGLPRVFGVINVSCELNKKGHNIDYLRNAIYKLVFDLTHPVRKNEKLLGHMVPKKYILLQKCIAEIVQERKNDGKEPVLDTGSYLLTVMNKMMNNPTETRGFRNKEDLYQATRFLHENGLLCHFEDLPLRDQYFLDPQWLCDQLAKVVSIREVQKYSKHGVMKLSDLQLTYRHSDRIGKYILGLLNKFEVALQFDADHLLLPSLLPTDKDLEPTCMKEIPLRRKGIDTTTTLLQSTDSSTDLGSFLFDQPGRGRPGDMCILSTNSETSVHFSNTRLYLLTYFPSGFWPRLITRLLADDTFYEPVMTMFPFSPEMHDKCPELLQKANPYWRCWQTGLELVYFGNVIAQVKEVHSGVGYANGMCNYDANGLKLQCCFDNNWTKLCVDDSVILEISFHTDKLTFNFRNNEHESFQSIESKQFDYSEKARAAILCKIVEHVDALLQDWYPELGEARFIQSCMGRYLVTRVIPCPLCLYDEVQQQVKVKDAWQLIDARATHADPPVTERPGAAPAARTVHAGDAPERILYTFLVEKCIKNELDGIDEVCKKHGVVSPVCMPIQDGETRMLYLAPDLAFHDLDQSFVLEDQMLHLGQELGQGAFGKVMAGTLKRGDTTIHDVAVKVLYDLADISRSQRKLATQIALETVCQAYTTARQELSILQTVQHPHIVPLLGLARHPLALILSRAPLGSLGGVLEKRHKDGLSLPSFVIKQIIIQVADALDYLHKRSIIYRDLKSENVLVWNFPTTTDVRQPVMVKLADYGISRSIMPTGAKGFGGTPPFIAPEILVHAGKDTYTEKVDIFSFGMFMFELLTCRQPLADFSNPVAHVCHGGRPTVSSEEAVCPSYMLDLMVICWDHEPQNRPSAAQVRMIASCPQFCHLTDAVSMETASTVLAATSVYVDSSVSGGQQDVTQVWLATQLGPNYNVEVLTYNQAHSCVGNEILQQSAKIYSLCAVNNTVWCLDSEGVIHVYSSESMEKQSEHHLEVNTLSFVISMFHHHGDGGHVILLFREQGERYPTLYCIPDTLTRCDSWVPVKMDIDCHCVAAVQSTSGWRLWFGVGQGLVSVRAPTQPLLEVATLNPITLTHVTDVVCKFIITNPGQAMAMSAWTYNYPGGKVYRWDTDKLAVVATLSCSTLIPATDTYRVSQSRTFEAIHYQVTAMTVVDQYLYVSTTLGCVIITDALSLQPYSVFRCHASDEPYCKSILPLGPVDEPETIYSRSETIAGQTRPGNSVNRGVVTVGRGYIDIIQYVTRLERQALVRGEAEDGWSMVETGSVPTSEKKKDLTSSHTYILSWTADNWEYY